MTLPSQVALSAATVVVAGWIGFAIIMIRRAKPPMAEHSAKVPQRRDRRSMVGIALQGASYAFVWSPPHWGFAKLFLSGTPDGWNAIAVAWFSLVVALTVSGDLLLRSAVRTLGREWSLVARVAQGHRLVMSGPYARVRHPIYTAMLIMLFATGLALSGPVPLGVGLLLFALGTAQRIRIEEGLLRASFGPEFDSYAARVPAVLPRPTKQ